MIKRDSKGRFLKGEKREDLIGNSYGKGNIPWNKNKKGLVKPNSGSFKKGNKPIIHKNTLLKRSNSIKKFWKEHPGVLRKIIDATKTQITQEIVDKIINLYKKYNDGTKVARELHIGDKKIYEILEASNLGYKWGKNPKSFKNGFQEGHDVPEEWKKKWIENRPTMIGKNNPAWLDGRSFEPYTPECSFQNFFIELLLFSKVFL